MFEEFPLYTGDFLAPFLDGTLNSKLLPSDTDGDKAVTLLERTRL